MIYQIKFVDSNNILYNEVYTDYLEFAIRIWELDKAGMVYDTKAIDGMD